MLNSVSIRILFDRNGRATRRQAVHPVPGLVQLSVNVNGERRYVSTGVRVYTDEWSGGYVIGRSDHQELNDRILFLTREVTRLVNECDDRGERFSFSCLDSVFYRKGSCSWVNWMQQDMESRALAEGTRKHHRTVLEWLKSQGVTDCGQMTTDTVMRLDNELRKRKVAGKPMMQTSIYGYHKVLRGYIRRAMLAGILSSDPYVRFKVSKGTSRPREILTMDEINAIRELKTRNLYMQHVRDLFLVQIYSGLSYCDLVSTDWSQVDMDSDILRGTRGKTGVAYTTMLLEPVREIVRHYRGHLPVMAYDDYRRMIMPLCEMCGITGKRISTHCGRHTFATTIALEHGIPMEVVSKMLGHTSIKTTQIYAKVQDRNVSEAASYLAARICHQ